MKTYIKGRDKIHPTRMSSKVDSLIISLTVMEPDMLICSFTWHVIRQQLIDYLPNKSQKQTNKSSSYYQETL